VVAEYFCTPERTVVFAARADWDEPRAAHLPLDYAALQRFAAGTFRQPGGVRMMMEDLADGGLGAWHQFAGLLRPLADWAARDDIIYLVPYGILHGLPLHTLPLDGAPLLDRNPVCYAPAAAVLPPRSLRERRRGRLRERRRGRIWRLARRPPGVAAVCPADYAVRPPSMYRISPVTYGADSRYRMPSTMSLT
jgi:hypothetical protein